MLPSAGPYTFLPRATLVHIRLEGGPRPPQAIARGHGARSSASSARSPSNGETVRRSGVGRQGPRRGRARETWTRAHPTSPDLRSPACTGQSLTQVLERRLEWHGRHRRGNSDREARSGHAAGTIEKLRSGGRRLHEERGARGDAPQRRSSLERGARCPTGAGADRSVCPQAKDQPMGVPDRSGVPTPVGRRRWTRTSSRVEATPSSRPEAPSDTPSVRGTLELPRQLGHPHTGCRRRSAPRLQCRARRRRAPLTRAASGSHETPWT